MPFVNPWEALVDVTLVGGSVWVWRHVAARNRQEEPPLEERPREDGSPPPLLVAVLFVFAFLSLAFAFTLDSKLPSKQPGEVLAKIRDEIVFSAVIASVIFVVMVTSAIPGDSWGNVLPSRDDGRVVTGSFFAMIGPTLALLYLIPFLPNEPGGDHVLVTVLRNHGSAALWAAVTFSAVVIAPVLEELIYRCVLQTSLTQWMTPEYGISLIALLFAGVHGPQLFGPLLPIALTLGYVWHQRRSLPVNIAIHAAFNAFMLARLALQVNTAS